MKKRALLFFILPLALSGCAQLFDTNLYGSIDTPPALNATALAAKTPDQVQQLLTDPTTFTQLKNDPAALKALQDSQEAIMQSGTATDAEKAVAAKNYIIATAKGSETFTVVNNVLGAFLPVLTSPSGVGNLGSDNATLTDTVETLFQGMTSAQVTATLLNLNSIAGALATLDTSTTTDTAFFQDTNAGELAQIGIVAAAVSALMAGANGADDAAKAASVAGLITSTSPASYISDNFNSTTLDTQFGNLANGFSGSGSAGSFSYMTTLKTVLPLGS